MSAKQHGILIVGNHCSAVHGNRAVCEDLADQLESTGWTVIRASRKRSALARLSDMLWTTWRNRKDYQVAQVDVFSGKAMIWAEAVCTFLRWLGKPYVLTLHGGNLPTFSRNRAPRVRRLFRSAFMVTTPSGFLHQEMKQYREDLRRLPNPLSLAKYTYRLRQNPAPRMVWLRAFHSMYNPAQAASVLRNLLNEAPHAHLEMIGPDKGDGSLSAFQNLVRDLHLEDAVQISGVVPKAAVPVRLNEADIFLNTTDVDNAPVSVTEAMASGLCIVSTDVGGLPYLLEHEQTALLVPPRDAAAMTNAIRRLFDEPGLAETLSRNARARAETFSWDALLPQWEEILSLAIGSASSRVTLVGVAGAGSTASSSR